MSRTVDQFANLTPSAAPSEADLEAWAKLPRDEQVRRYQALFAGAECNNFTSETPEDILIAARRRVADRGHG